MNVTGQRAMPLLLKRGRRGCPGEKRAVLIPRTAVLLSYHDQAVFVFGMGRDIFVFVYLCVSVCLCKCMCFWVCRGLHCRHADIRTETGKREGGRV